MRTKLCDQFGIEFPIFAFTHCRDVVAAVSKAGGFGVLGAVGFSAEQLEIELDWIDEHIGDQPYGVDIVIPGKYEGMGELDAEKLEADAARVDARAARDFAAAVLAEHGVPELPEGERSHSAARLDRGDGDAPDRGGAQARQGAADRQRARHPAHRRDRGDPRAAGARSPPCAAPPSTRSSTRRPASTSSSPRATRAAGTPARSAASCSGPR